MTNKEWLMRAWNIDKEIKSLLTERDEAFSKCTQITAQLKKDMVASSGAPQKDHWLVTLAEYDNDIGQRVDELVKTKREILEEIRKIENCTYRTLLYMRYLRFKTWEEIAVEMNYTYRHVVRIHGEALVNMNGVDK